MKQPEHPLSPYKYRDPDAYQITILNKKGHIAWEPVSSLTIDQLQQVVCKFLDVQGTIQSHLNEGLDLLMALNQKENRG